MRLVILVPVFLLSFSLPVIASEEEGVKIPFIKYETSTVILSQPEGSTTTPLNNGMGTIQLNSYFGDGLKVGGIMQVRNSSLTGSLGQAACEYIVNAVTGDETINPSVVAAIVSSAKKAYCIKDVSQVSLTLGGDGGGSIGVANAGIQAGVNITIECNKK